jgi:hypothetical protein
MNSRYGTERRGGGQEGNWEYWVRNILEIAMAVFHHINLLTINKT